MINKLLLCALATAIALPAAAQSNNTDNDHNHKSDFTTRIGIKGGFNIANLTTSSDGNINNRNTIASYNAGVYADMELLPLFAIQPGIFLTGKGAKFTAGDDQSASYARVTTRPVYLEVPVNAVVKVPLPSHVKLFAGAGPYIAMGVAGKNTTEGQLAGTGFTDSYSIKYGNDDANNTNGSAYSGNLKRFDAGLNFIAGLEINHFTLNANYGYGVVNLRPGSSNTNNENFKNRVFSLQVGLLL